MSDREGQLNALCLSCPSEAGIGLEASAAHVDPEGVPGPNPTHGNLQGLSTGNTARARRFAHDNSLHGDRAVRACWACLLSH
jgi:hypothetical protein